MLRTLVIKNLALIAAQDVEFADGLNIITGETGAGKSILIGAVELLLGERADKSQIRTGASSCELHVILDIPAAANVLATVDAILDEAGAPACEDGQLIGRRKLTASSSRSFVNSVPVGLQLLRQLGEHLVDLHGAYDNQSLLRPASQLEALDTFAANEDALDGYRRAWDKLQALQAELDAAADETPSQELLDFLRFQLDEIDKAELREGEDDELSQRHAAAAHVQTVQETLAAAAAALDEDDGAAVERAAAVRRDLIDLARVDGEPERRWGETLDTCISQLQEIAVELAEYAAGAELDPQEFAMLEDRLGLVNRLKRKYGGSIESALAHADDCRERLNKLEHYDDFRAEMQRKIDAAAKTVQTAAGKLRRRRAAAADKLAPAVTDKLKLLGFPDCDFRVRLEPCDPGRRGADDIDFYFAPNPGEGSRPLREIASSGEISRVMLALKTILADADRIPLLIFDEVDANVGGKVANKVGDELRELSRRHQVICITHQPQVAARADRHFRVAKQTEGGRTTATIDVLEGKAREHELIRMLGGDPGDKTVARHARELLKQNQPG